MRKYLVGMWDAACPHEQAEDALPMGSLPAPWEHPARPRGAPHGLGTVGGRWLWVPRGDQGWLCPGKRQDRGRQRLWDGTRNASPLSRCSQASCQGKRPRCATPQLSKGAPGS